MTRLYRYVGPNDIRFSVASFPSGTRIESVKDIEGWIHETRQQPDASGLIAATFIVDFEGYLRIAERHSEHVACAGGEAVLSAGEIFFVRGKQGLEVAEISNQSTGFCPEPESWISVAKALDQILLCHPNRFTTEFTFRRCSACRQLNLVKENQFFCAVCNKDLSIIWNCGD